MRLISSPSWQSFAASSLSAQLQRAPVESQQHTTIEEQISIFIITQDHMCVNHTNAYINKYTRIWKKTRISLLRWKVARGLQPYVLTQHHPPARKSLLHLKQVLDHPILWIYTRKATTLLYKIQNSSLRISVMRDPYIDDYREVSHLLGSWLVSSLL